MSFSPNLPDWIGYLAAGQSLGCGVRAVPPVSTAADNLSNLGFAGGCRAGVPGNAYTGGNTDPGTSSVVGLFEDSTGQFALAGDTYGETNCSRAARRITSEAMRRKGLPPGRCIIAASSPGRGGLAIIGHVRGSTPWYAKRGHMLAFTQLAAAQGKTYGARIHNFHQGQADATGTGSPPTPTSYASYYSDLDVRIVTQTNDDAWQMTGQREPCFTTIMQTSHLTQTTSNIATAQFDVCRANPLACFVAPDWIFEMSMNTAGGAYADFLHKSNVGQRLQGEYIGRAAYQILFEGRKPDFFNPVSAYWRNGRFYIDVKAPTPIVLDTTIGGTTTQNGLRVLDANGNVALTDIKVDSTIISSAGTYRISAAGAQPSGAWVMRMGLDYIGANLPVKGPDQGYGVTYSAVAGAPLTGGTNYAAYCATSNFRDTTADTTTIAGLTYPMWHVAPHCSLAGFTFPPSN